MMLPGNGRPVVESITSTHLRDPALAWQKAELVGKEAGAGAVVGQIAPELRRRRVQARGARRSPPAGTPRS